MKQIQEWLGHSDISTTANIYAHLDSQSKQLSAATMEQALALPEELPKAGGKMGKRNPRGKPLGFWRSIRDLNSGGAVNALSHFECDLFDLLSNAPYEIVRHRPRASSGRMRDFGARTAIFRRGARPRKARRCGIHCGQTGQWVTPFRVLPLTTS